MSEVGKEQGKKVEVLSELALNLFKCEVRFDHIQPGIVVIFPGDSEDNIVVRVYSIYMVRWHFSTKVHQYSSCNF